MEKSGFNLNKFSYSLTYASLVILALGLVTSISIMSLYHILMIVPILVFSPKIEWRRYSLSAKALMSLSLIIALSVIFNQDIAHNGYKPVGKVKYFLYGFLAIAPSFYYFRSEYSDKKVSYLIYALCIATSFASLVGIFSRYWEFNPITWRVVAPERNAGLFGMVMNYAHNVAFFQIIVTGMIFYRKSISRFINLNFLYIVFAINLCGLYFTYTRGAWLAYICGVPFLLLKESKKLFMLVMVGIFLMGALGYVAAGKYVIRPQSDSERLSQWKAAVMAFKERPVLGYGYLNFERHSVDIKKRYGIDQVQFGGHAHNNFFEMLGSCGILGFVAFGVWLLSWFVEMYKGPDLVSKITLPFIIVFLVGGLTQSTIALGVNLFFVMSVYSLSQVSPMINKK